MGQQGDRCIAILSAHSPQVDSRRMAQGWLRHPVTRQCGYGTAERAIALPFSKAI